MNYYRCTEEDGIRAFEANSMQEAVDRSAQKFIDEYDEDTIESLTEFWQLIQRVEQCSIVAPVIQDQFLGVSERARLETITMCPPEQPKVKFADNLRAMVPSQYHSMFIHHDNDHFNWDVTSTCGRLMSEKVQDAADMISSIEHIYTENGSVGFDETVKNIEQAIWKQCSIECLVIAYG